MGGINSCNAMIGAVFPSKTRLFSVTVTVFLSCFVGVDCCNVVPFLYRILSVWNTICSNFVSNGTGRIRSEYGLGWFRVQFGLARSAVSLYSLMKTRQRTTPNTVLARTPPKEGLE